jgi:hypothetical protein
MLAEFGVEKTEKRIPLNSLQHDYNLSSTLPFLNLRGGWERAAGASLARIYSNIFLEDCIM